MPIQSGGRAPYAPPAAILSFLESFRDRPLPTPFTLEVLSRAGVSESLVPRTLKSLEDLDLIDSSGTPTPELEGLKRAPQEEYRQRLEAIVRNVYAEVFRYVDPSKDDPRRVPDQFRAFEPMGQRGRMVTLFMGLCEAAGIIPEGTRKPTAISSTRPTAKKVTPKRANDGDRGNDQSSVKYNVRSDEGGLVPEPILGLMRGVRWRGETQAKREHLEKAFKATLDFVLPIVPAEEMDLEPADAEDDT